MIDFAGHVQDRMLGVQLAYAILQLNAQVHGEEKDVSPEDFSVQLATIDSISAVSEGYIATMYSSVKEQPLQPLADHTDEIRARCLRLTHLPEGKDNPAQWAQPHRFFVKDYSVVLIEDVEVPTPRGKRKRTVTIFSDLVLLCKSRKNSMLEFRQIVPIQSCRCRFLKNDLYPTAVVLFDSMSGKVLLNLALPDQARQREFARVINCLELQVDFETSRRAEILDELVGAIDNDEGDGRLEVYLASCKTAVDAQSIKRRLMKFDGVLSISIKKTDNKGVIKYDPDILGPHRIIRFIRGFECDCYMYDERPKEDPEDLLATKLKQHADRLKQRGIMASAHAGSDSDDSDEYVDQALAAGGSDSDGSDVFEDDDAPPVGSDSPADGHAGQGDAADSDDSDEYAPHGSPRKAADLGIAELTETIQSFDASLTTLDHNVDAQITALRLKARMVASRSQLEARELEKQAKKLEDVHKANAQKEKDKVIRDRLLAAQAKERSGSKVAIGFTSYYSEEAIFQAANEGDLAMLIELLSEATADVNKKDPDRRTPLMHCVHHNHMGCVELLLAKGADVNHQSSIGGTVLHEAAFHTDAIMIKRLVEWKADINIQDQGMRTALHWATDNPATDPLNALLEYAGKDPEFINKAASDGMTPIMYAAYNNRVHHVQSLLEHGADLEEKDVDGKTAMHWAINRRDHQCLQKLLTDAGQTFFKDNMGRTVIHKAAELGCPDAVLYILELRSELGPALPAWADTDKEGRTPLMWAVAANNRATTRCLLQEGCDSNVMDLSGHTALQHAEALGHSKCSALIKEAVAERVLEQHRILTNAKADAKERIAHARKQAW